MTGLYYMTAYRNEQTGETCFYFSPSEPCPFVANGLVKCYGKIGIYAKNIPMQIEGEYKDGVFYVSSDCIPSKKKGDIFRILEYITDKLTETQKENIAQIVENDFFNFISNPDAAQKLEDVLAGCRDRDKLVNLILDRAYAMRDREELTKLLLAYDVPVDRIEYLHTKGCTIQSLSRNPYMPLLYADIPIEKAEMVASELCGIHPYDMARLKAFVYESMTMSLKSGHTCYPIKQLCSLINHRMATYGIFPVSINISILNLCLSEMKNMFGIHEVNGELFVYFNHVWEEENSAIRHIMRLKTSSQPFIKDIDIPRIETHLGISYNQGQKEVFHALDTSGIKILTGPPGSGKTAVIRGLLEACKAGKRIGIKLAATTGRASQVMKNACGQDAVTVNKLLDVRPFQGNTSSKNANNPVIADLIIVDEVSMLGLQLFSLLVSAVRTGGTLLLVGDEDQLQSVEYGNILHDLISSGVAEVFRLTEVIRQSGTICKNASRINAGIEDLECDDTFTIYRCQSEDQAQEMLIKEIGGNKTDQVMSPVKKGGIGTWKLNNLLQDKTGRRLLDYGKTSFFMGDRVIMTKTNYDAGYFNGDIGTIIQVEKGALIVAFPDKTLRLCRSDLCYMSLAYAVTVHKAQGSESDRIHILLPDAAKGMLTRRVLYTAVTRAKKKVCIYSVNDALELAIQNAADIQRTTMLAHRLKNRNISY